MWDGFDRSSRQCSLFPRHAKHTNKDQKGTRVARLSYVWWINTVQRGTPHWSQDKCKVFSTLAEVFLRNYASSSKWLTTQKSKVVVSHLFPQAQIPTTLCKTMVLSICKTGGIMTLHACTLVGQGNGQMVHLLFCSSSYPFSLLGATKTSTLHSVRSLLLSL